MNLQLGTQSSLSYQRRFRRLTALTLAETSRIWNLTSSGNFGDTAARVSAELEAVLKSAQAMAVDVASGYVRDASLELGLPTPSYNLNSAAVVGITGSGMPVASLPGGAISQTIKGFRSRGLTVFQAVQTGKKVLQRDVVTLLNDTRNVVEKVGFNSRQVTLYVRGLTPPSCGRCVVLAGKTTGDKEPFLRHPQCDCVNIPATSREATAWHTSAQGYLQSLDDAQLLKLLGSKANLQAFRDGASFNQLINAYRRKGYVRSAQMYGREVKVTLNGSGRTRSKIRLMPESIYRFADSPEDARRLLRVHGWIF